MRILPVASEGVPFTTTGGLADVAGALPRLAAASSLPALLLPLLAQSSPTAQRAAAETRPPGEATSGEQ